VFEPSFIEKEITIPGFKGQCRFLHITDSHITAWDDRIIGNVIASGPHKDKRLIDFAAMRCEHFKRDGVATTERFAAMCDALAECPDCADAAVFTGDILDYYTEAAFDIMCENIAKLPMPFIFVPGNHDMIFSGLTESEIRARFEAICGGSTNVQKLKVGGLALIGIDDTRNYYTEAAIAELKTALEGENAALLFQHVPLSTEEYHAYAMEKNGRDYSLGFDNICVNHSWREVMDIIEAEDSPIKALICGDAHIDHESRLTDKVKQYISPYNVDFPPVRFTVHG